MKYNCKYIIPVLLVACCHLSIKAQTVQSKDSSVTGAGEKVNVLYGKQAYNRFVGNMNAVSGEDLRTYPSIMVQEALAGQIPGLFMLQNNGNPGEDNFTSYVRGSVGGFITLVDGIERPLTPYDIEQIEEVRLLKDPVSKALYGGRISNGILMVSTRRGKAQKSEFHASVQRGTKRPTNLPEYLNSYDFARYYNQALANDGITNGVYSPETIEAYRTGSNRFRNPDVDFYGEFLNKAMDVTRVSTEYYGGNATTQFYVHGGYQNEGGFEKFASKSRQIQAFNLQGNVDSRYSDAITLHANFAGYMAVKQYPGELGGPILGTLATRYPNAYPILVGKDSVGGTTTFRDNPYGQQAQRGYTQENNLRMQTDLGFDVKLDKLVKGLTLKPAYSFDIYHKQNLQKLNTVGIYSVASYNADSTPATLNTIQVPQKQTGQSLADDDYGRRWGFINTLNYQMEEGRSALDADLIYFISKEVYAGEFQDYKRQSLGLRVNYTLDGKYTLEAVGTYTGSQSYTPDNRFKTYPAFGAGWLISKEKFMKKASFINFLKLNGSWGIMGNGDIGANQWRQTWGRTNGNYPFNLSNTGSTTQLNQVGSNILDWPSQREVDISLEATMFKKISWKFSYFDYMQRDNLSKKGNVTPSIIGGDLFLPQSNFGKTGLTGIEAEASYSGAAAGFTYQIGAHFTYSKSKKVVIDELPDPDYSETGTPFDAIWGYSAIGTYTQSEIDQIAAGTSTLPIPSFFTNARALKVGNIKYADLNDDGVIDKYDTRIIGNNRPRIMFGTDLNVGYKGFNLYAMFLGYGQYNSAFNNNYYAVNSTRKYSKSVVDGLPNGNPHPLLTTTAGENDFAVSDYWIANNSFFKLQNIALSYALPKGVIDRIKAREVKIFLYGTDVFTVSKVTKSDPESLNAGLADYPLFKTFAAGLTVTF